MHFYKMTGMIKTSNKLFSLNNKRFIMLENKPFVMSVLLLKYPKFDQKLIVFINKLLTKIFSRNNKFVGILYANLITFFNKLELYDLLGLRGNKYDLNKKVKVINGDLFKMSRFDKKIKRCLSLYLCIINSFFNYIGFSKMINILKRVLLCSTKEKKINNLKTILEIYLRKFNFNSLYLLMGLIKYFLMIKKILKSIYTMK
jgi:hypothetical protein